jgi:outer membrane protein assembly factor BamB
MVCFKGLFKMVTKITKIKAGVLLILLTLTTNYFIVESVSSSELKINENRYSKGFRYNIQGWIYLHIEGEPYERGYQYGYLTAKEIADSLERWREFIINKHKEKYWLDFVVLPRNLEQKIWDVYIKKANLNFLNKVPEEFKQEMQGMTDGMQARDIMIFDNKEVTFDDILVMQFVQDIMYSSFMYRNKRMNLINYCTSKLLSKIPVPNVVNNILERFLDRFLSTDDYEYHPGHCSAFIATGEYTKDGGIVAAHSTVFDPLMAQRCNLVVNVKPLTGYSFTMTTFPGSLWSQEDWYQNEKGIILTETELPQGPFNIRKTPKGIRSRTAIQYSETIDDVINILQEGNNGLIPNEWLIGDIKTGEIASLEQAYFNTPIKRTYSGFYGSYNVPHDDEVRAELFGLKNIFEPIGQIFYGAYSNNRDVEFERIKEKYKGKIDVESVKEILATYPICNKVTDGKITTSSLLKNNGLLVHIGNPNGIKIVTSEKAKEKYSRITDLPAAGWLEVYNSELKNIEIDLEKMAPIGFSSSTDVLWYFNKDTKNDFYNPFIAMGDDELLAGFSNGEFLVLSKNPGEKKDRINLGMNVFEIRVSEENIFVASSKGIVSLDKNSKEVAWEKVSEKRVHSISDAYNDVIFAGCIDGSLYALDSKYGLIQWHHTFEDPVYVSKNVKDKLFFASGSKCYAMSKGGQVLWSFDSGGLITSSPVYKNGKVFFGSWDNKAYCLDEKDGSEIWSFKTNWGIASSAEITENQVFVGGLDGNLYALDKKTGELDWFYKSKAAIHSKPVSYGDYVFFGSDDGRVYALDKKTGGNIWNFAPGYTIDGGVNNYITSPILSELVLDDGVLYLAINNDVYALNAQTFEEIEESDEKLQDISQGLLLIVIILIILCLIIVIWVFTKKKKGFF